VLAHLESFLSSDLLKFEKIGYYPFLINKLSFSIMADLRAFLRAYPAGASAGEMEHALGIPRSSLNRLLKQEVEKGSLLRFGRGASVRYRLADPHAVIRAYFERPFTERPIARFDPEKLKAEPGLSEESLRRFATLKPYILDKRQLVKFLIDFACASSLLEGGTYSMLDTQALIEYGEHVSDKPLADAYLVLNHKEAFDYLYGHMSLDSIFEVHARLTSDHERAELKNTPHFLEKEFRGVVREYADIDIAQSTYQPPFRPGTGFLEKALHQVLATSLEISNPIQAAFYLMTRIAYLQPFKDGNKRTSRALCNVPLILANLPPISFVDFNKRDYILSMLAFYELGDLSLAEDSFVRAYQKSIQRLGGNLLD
jgi:hypothetical protein